MHDNEFLLNVSFYGDKLRVFLTKKIRQLIKETFYIGTAHFSLPRYLIFGHNLSHSSPETNVSVSICINNNPVTACVLIQ